MRQERRQRREEERVDQDEHAHEQQQPPQRPGQGRLRPAERGHEEDRLLLDEGLQPRLDPLVELTHRWRISYLKI